MEYINRLYQILFPNPSLICSQLNPVQFARHYISGSTRFYNGKVLFAEIDIHFRHPYFQIEETLKEMRPHENGRPKSTKFISSYRVLEHMDFKAVKNLFLTTPEGYCLELKESPHTSHHESGHLRIFVEITPLRMLVLTRFNFVEFADYITNPNNPKGAPKFFYTQLDLNMEEFLKDFEDNPFMVPPIATIHPSRLRDAIIELSTLKQKRTKGLNLDSTFDRIPYKMIRHGFMFASQGEKKFYPMPSLEEIEKQNYKFWRSM